MDILLNKGEVEKSLIHYMYEVLIVRCALVTKKERFFKKRPVDLRLLYILQANPFHRLNKMVIVWIFESFLKNNFLNAALI